MPHEIKFIVENSKGQRARRPHVTRTGKLLVYLTRRHYRVFMFIAERILEERDAPSYQEIADWAGYTNRDSALRAVRTISELGLLATDVNRARSFRITKQGEAVYRQWKEKARR